MFSYVLGVYFSPIDPGINSCSVQKNRLFLTTVLTPFKSWHRNTSVKLKVRSK